jgi:hypothetical protein
MANTNLKQETLVEGWEFRIRTQLKGKTIADVRYMTEDEAREMMWYHRPLVIIFTDGSYIFPSQDDEGNDGGAMYTSFEKLPVIPVMR